MKKLLALVLALVMTMSLVTISNAAYDDAADIDYTEAVEVMSAIGVLKGDETGKFLPDGQLTRAAAAKIVAYLMYAGDAESMATTAAPYADVPASHWAAGYIAALSADGVVAGVGDGKFNPEGDVTALQFAKMLLVALGYDAAIEGLTGSDWSINTSKLANKKGIKLFAGNDSVKVNAVATRQEAALYAFNALKAETVEYDNKGTTVTVNGATISTGAGAAKGTGDLLREELYEGLKPVAGEDADDFGRPASKWTYKGETYGPYSKDASFVLTTEFNGNELQDAATAAGVGFNTKGHFDTKLTVKVDGAIVENKLNAADTDSFLSAFAKTDFAWSGKGVVVEAFADDDDMVDTLVVTNIYVATAENIIKDKASTKSVDERAFYLDSKKVENDVEGFDAVYAGLEEGDYVLYNKAGATVKAVSLPTSVTGDISSYKAGSSVTVAGKVYTMNANTIFTTEAGKTGVTVYLDKFGYAVACDSTSSADASLAVLKLYSGLNSDGEIVDMASVVYADGTTANIQLKDKTGVAANSIYTYAEDDDDANKIVLTAVGTASAAVDGDNEGESFKTIKAIVDTDKGVVLYGTAKNYFAAGCKFVYVDDGKFTVSNTLQDVASGKAVAVIDKDGNVSAMFIQGAAKSSVKDSSALIFIAAADGETSVLDKDGKAKTVYAYKAFIDGVAVENFVAEKKNASVGFYSSEYDADNHWYVLSGNDFTDSKGILSAVDETVADLAAGKYVTLSNSDEIEVTSTTKFASNVEDYAVDNVNDFKALADNDTEIDNMTVSFLYDEDTGVALYAYVTVVTEA